MDPARGIVLPVMDWPNMDWFVFARAVHVVAIVHWIGGVFFVTAVILPAVRRMAAPAERLALFERIEGRFSRQAKVSVTLAGVSGFYLTYRLDAWDRFTDPAAWWMAGMLLVWTLFFLVLFVAEPLFLHRWFHERATRDPDAIFALVERAHRVLLGLSLVVVAGAVAGAHGF
jgi:uncharacterized membrane protein